MIRPYLGKLPVIPASAYIDISAQVIGDVEIGEHSSVWMNAVVRGDANSIRIGERSNVQDGAVLHGMRNEYPVVVGDGVSIGHNAVVHGCTVEDNVLIGMGATILNGARVGCDSIVAAGALVLQRVAIPPRSLVVGHPAKVKRTLTDEEVESIRVFTRNYLEYTKNYLAESKK